jgi:hypothetical protein
MAKILARKGAFILFLISKILSINLTEDGAFENIDNSRKLIISAPGVFSLLIHIETREYVCKIKAERGGMCLFAHGGSGHKNHHQRGFQLFSRVVV